MENTLQINDQQLMIKEYESQRVVTMWDIATLHNTTTKHIRDNFRNNLKYLIEGEDYCLLEKTDKFVCDLIAKEDLNKKAVNRAKDIPIFTETGYLMMTKPMTDELSWQVQRTLIKSYFKVKEIAKAKITEVTEQPKLQDLSEINKTIELMNSMFSKSRFSDSEKMILVSSLLETAGIELPEIKLSEPANKANYITLDDLAIRVGLYREDKTPNVEATMVFIRYVGLTLEDMNLRLRTGDSGGYWFNIKFNPHFVERISQYLEEAQYPRTIDCKQIDGRIITIPIYYRQL
jgi:hypothetical protein